MTGDASPAVDRLTDRDQRPDDQLAPAGVEPGDQTPAGQVDEEQTPAGELDEEQTAAVAEVDEEQTAAVAEVDEEAQRRRVEALRYVRKLGDPALRARAIPVDRFDEDLRREVARMGLLMDAAMGVGLAATQLGVLHRVLVYRVEHDSPVVALINPTIEWAGREQETVEEGCLSLPGVAVDVERAVHLRVGARDEQGEQITVEASGLEARVIAHEIDHLDGILILDRTTREQRREAMRRLREGQAGD
jgi:peptide deformylase